VTFDDAYAGVFEYAMPVLHTLSLPATVFVIAEAPGRDTGFWWDQPGIARTETPARREIWLKELRGDGRAIAAPETSNGDMSLPASHRPADWKTVRAALGRDIAVGAHSVSHRSLPTLTDAELEHEVVASRAIVEEATGSRPDFFAYPYGYWDSRVRAMVRSVGFRAGLTLDDGRNAPLADPWSLRRINIPTGISDAAFEAWTAGFHGRRSA
jgi:peptidoglycan/xylan/chitin deacetylase (PgdA/CDA1 family)